MWGFKLCPFIVIGMMPLCLGGILKVDFTTVILCCCSVYGVPVKNEPSLCMNIYFSESKLYDKEYLDV